MCSRKKVFLILSVFRYTLEHELQQLIQLTMQYDVFISYRRLDSKGRVEGRDIARLLSKELKLYGYNVFFDYTEIRDNDFEQEILPAVRTSKVFMLILTSDALTRCENQGDWVRREITEAHLSERKIITVNPDYSFNSFPRHLPEELQFLKTVQMSSIDMGPNFEVTVEKMVRDRIQPIVPSSRIADSIPDKPGTIKVELGNKAFEIPDEFFHIEVYKALKRSYL